MTEIKYMITDPRAELIRLLEIEQAMAGIESSTNKKRAEHRNKAVALSHALEIVDCYFRCNETGQSQKMRDYETIVREVKGGA